MAGRITLWGAGELLTSFFSKVGQVPDNFYLALIKDAPPTPYISGSELDEPKALLLPNGYARVAIPNNVHGFTNKGQLQVVSLDLDLLFPEAVIDWGTIRYWALCNASVGGFVYFTGTLDKPQVINKGDQAKVSAGDLSISLGPFSTEVS